ncbi:ABC transporter permease [Promicromonospora citrea]|uniref:Autoinducer 2 import system permease protein LsrD n=1 Tax=Promicromonospora citrea TaxID=43677 RepID=A0A8H9GDK4_9MICO|nr:ABC transporter permease [Promicromonospora citrea]GGM08303.1 sugar ABC transporter permease [Promicromonospora citrea]
MSAPTNRPVPTHARPWWQRALLTREMLTLAILAVAWVVASATVRGFDGPLTITYLVLDIAPVLLIALPMTLVVATGEIDLSVASVVGLSSVTFGLLFQAGAGPWQAALVSVLLGAVCGAVNGALVAYAGLPSLAVTIGSLALYRGLAVGLLGTTAVTGFPDAWTDGATANLGGSPWPVITLVLAALVAVFALLLHATPFGRDVLDIGRSREAARFSGVDVRRTLLVLFVLSGAVSALAGVYYTLRYGSARGDNATGLELQVVAAVLLGGVSIFGGRGALHGVVGGVLLIGVLGSALRLEGVTVNVINIVIGTALVVSVVAPRVAGGLRVRRRAAAPAGGGPAAGRRTEGDGR